ncbi:hypothetical protein PO909_034047 [Leuciscus waleckii]
MSGKKKQYTKEVLKKAVEDVRAGASLRQTSKKYGIPHTTLQDYKKKKYTLNPHPNSALTPAEEDALISFIFWMADHGFPVTRALVKVLASGIIKESGRADSTTVNLEKGPSDVWWSRFKARHPELTSRTADSLDRARVHGATPEAIEGFFQLYEALYIRHSLEDKPHLVFNCDETGFGDKLRSREKTGFSIMASRMGLVRGDLVVGKKQFSSLLKTVYPTAVTAHNIKAGFRKAGIFPLSRGAVDTTQVVRVLPSADARPSVAPVTPSATPPIAPVTPSATPSIAPVTPSATPSIAPVTPITPSATPPIAPVTPSATPSIAPVTPSATPSIAPVTPSDTPSGAPAPLTHTYSDPTTDTQTSATPSTTPTPCPTCKRGIPKNYLVAAGVIPESLANVLMSPALDRREKVRRRLPLPARVITSDGYVRLLEQKEAEEKEKEEKKRKRKEDMAKKKEGKKTRARGRKAEETGTTSN